VILLYRILVWISIGICAEVEPYPGRTVELSLRGTPPVCHCEEPHHPVIARSPVRGTKQPHHPVLARNPTILSLRGAPSGGRSNLDRTIAERKDTILQPYKPTPRSLGRQNFDPTPVRNRSIVPDLISSKSLIYFPLLSRDFLHKY